MVNSIAPYVAAPGHAEVERVVTASICHMKEGIYAQMEDIRAHSLRHNAVDGIHAILQYQSGWFIHWAEGPSPALRALLLRLAEDPRHHSPHTVHLSRGRRILPTPWSMVMSQAAESAVQFGRRVVALREQFEKGVQYAPSSVLRRLSAPMQLPQAQGLADPDAFHRVGICAAGGNEAFAMVAWLAQRTGGTVAKRRFAGEQDMDGSSEYVEFMEGGHPCRMIAVARNGLAAFCDAVQRRAQIRRCADGPHDRGLRGPAGHADLAGDRPERRNPRAHASRGPGGALGLPGRGHRQAR